MTIKRIREEARRTPVLEETDVLVNGGGPAGFTAAIAAARNGARVLLAEQRSFPGGCASLGLPFLGFYSDKRRRIVGGIPWELVKRLVKAKASPGLWLTGPDAKYKDSLVVTDVPMFRTVLGRMLAESGVKVLLHTLAASTIIKNGSIQGVITESKVGRQAILSTITVDATGDGDVAADAGAPFEKGDPQQGLLQPATLLFQVFDVDMDALLGDVEKHPVCYHIHSRRPLRYRADYRRGVRMQISGLEEICRKAAERGDYDVPNPYVIFVCLPQEGTLLVNMAKVKLVDGTDNRDLTRAELEGTENIWKVMYFLKKYVPGFKKAKVGWLAPSMGIRETRRIIADYTLNEDDMSAQVKFEDRIGMGGRYVDVHDPTPGNKAKSIYRVFPEGYYIPFRCLIPKKVGNLLVAGRCISVSYAAYGSTRVMAQCMVTGQAAGTAAALAVRENVPLRKLDVKQLQTALKQDGAIID